MNEIRPDVSADAIASLSRRLIRRWRGDRSQLVLSVSLGFSSNVVAHWETGRRVPRASVALQLLESSAPTTLEPLAELFGLEQGIAPATQEGVRQIVADALEAVPLRRAADAIGVQRSTIVRWLGGQLEPRLTDLLACLAIGLRLGQFLQLTGAADHEFAGVVPEEFGPPEYQVFHGLQLDAYRALPAHSTTWLAERLVLTGDEVEEAIRRLHVGGWIEPRGSYWMAALRAPVLRPGILTHEAMRAIREDAGRKLASTATARWFVAHAHCSPAEAGAAKDLLRRCYKEIGQLLTPTESRERLVQISMALVALDGTSVEES